MHGIHAFVAKKTADLIHPLQTAYDAHLQVQFGGDAQIHIDIQRVVVSDEGAGGGAAGRGIEHGSLYLHEALTVQIPADLGDNGAALAEGIPHLGIHKQIHITHTVLELGIFQAVELLRQGPQVLAQQLYVLCMDRDFAGAGLEYEARNANDVTDVPGLEGGIIFLTHIVPLYIDLDIPLAVQHMGKTGLAHDAFAHHAPGNADFPAFQFVIGGHNIPAVMGLVKGSDFKGVFPLFNKVVELIPPYLQKLRKLFCGKFLILQGGLFHSVSCLI